jgi:hypothetical protein
MDGGQFDGVSYCGEFLKLLEEHENNLINNSRLSALNEVQEIMNNLKYVHPEKFPYDNDEEDMIIDFKELNYEIDKLK